MEEAILIFLLVAVASLIISYFRSKRSVNDLFPPYQPDDKLRALNEILKQVSSESQSLIISADRHISGSFRDHDILLIYGQIGAPEISDAALWRSRNSTFALAGFEEHSWFESNSDIFKPTYIGTQYAIYRTDLLKMRPSKTFRKAILETSKNGYIRSVGYVQTSRQQGTQLLKWEPVRHELTANVRQNMIKALLLLATIVLFSGCSSLMQGVSAFDSDSRIQRRLYRLTPAGVTPNEVRIALQSRTDSISEYQSKQAGSPGLSFLKITRSS